MFIIIKKEEVADFLEKYVITREDEFKNELVKANLVDPDDLDDNYELALAVRDYLEDHPKEFPFAGIYWGSDSRDDDSDPWTLYTGGDCPAAYYYVVGTDAMTSDEVRNITKAFLPSDFDFEARLVAGCYDGMVATRDALGMPVWASPWDDETSWLISRKRETDFDFMTDLLGSEEESCLFWESV